MTVPPLPPAGLVLEMVRQDILPAAGGAAFAMAFILCLGRWAGPLGAAVGAIVGYAWANYTFDLLTWESTHRLIPWKPDRSTWHFLPQASLVLVGVGLASRWLGSLVGCMLPERRWWVANLLVWLPRWIAVLVVGSWLIPTPWVEAHTWLRPALGAAMLFSWIALDGLARSGASGEVSSYLAAIFLAASVLFIYAHSKLFMELAVVLGYVFFGIAAVARSARVDASGAIPAAVGFLPALALNVRFQTESLVPVSAFVLIALAPLALLPFSIPRLARQRRWLVMPLRALLVLLPLVFAVMLTLEYERLPPEEDW